MNRFVLAVAGAGAVALAACTHAASPSAAPARHTSSKVIVPVSCGQQYREWTNGKGKGLMDALGAVSSATASRNEKVLTVRLRRARLAVTEAVHHPIPACADPRGYWDVLLMHVTAATASKASPASVRAAMKDVDKIRKNLITEVKQASE